MIAASDTLAGDFDDLDEAAPVEPIVMPHEANGDAEPNVLNLAEFLDTEFPVREHILDPIVSRGGLVMVHAWRGLGKTYFTTSAALAAAAGGTFLRWSAPRAFNVLYVDGEMRGDDMQTRIAALYKATTPRPDPRAFRIITPDLQANGIPDLGTGEGQRWLERVLGDTDMLVLDNLSSLVRSGTDKEDEVWLPLLGWLLRLRSSGRAVWMVHHDGKNLTQRGTSRREDNLDTVIQLRKPENYRDSEGARFVVHFGKHRGFYGKAAEPFEAALVDDGGGLSWTMSAVEDALTTEVAELLGAGRSTREIAEQLSIGVATVQRHKAKAKKRGLL